MKKYFFWIQAYAKIEETTLYQITVTFRVSCRQINKQLPIRQFMIRTNGLSKVFRTDEVETTALNGISIEVNEGEFVAIMGPSGCGKTTLLNLLGLLDVPSSGDFFFNGVNVAGMGEKQRANVRKNNMGFVFQNFNLIEELTVFENVELPLIYLGMGSRQRKEKVDAVLESMNIRHRRNHFPLQLSGGQQQRVAVARAVVAGPKLILADEPTGNLDSAHGQEVMELLGQLNQNGTTIVMVTHSQRDAEYSRRIIRLFDGQVISENIQSQFSL